MCGIVGLFAKTDRYEPQLGELLAKMLETMTGRGPDSAGFAIYGEEQAGHMRLTIRPAQDAASDTPVDAIISHYAPEWRGSHVLITVPLEKVADVTASLRAVGATVVGIGTSMELYKGVGLPKDVAREFGLPDMSGTHALGHTRMATESAVTTDGAHPFNTGPDLCLVHNGSLSNHASLRRQLRPQGISFETENDSEVAAGYLTWRLGQGMSLKEALEESLNDLDGFFTFVVGTQNGFGVVRDPISCKPAVMAETDDLIAFGSEYRALAVLPNIETARVWEPEPATVYFWERAA